MAGTFYKYAERDADSQINWAEVGKGLSDMLAETNRVREEKKDALDAAQRETMNYLAETPNGEDATARKTVLEYSDQASNRMRIANQLLKNGQMSPKDYITFRQNVTDNTNLIFNANKVYQENFAETMQRSRDGISSALEPDRWKDAEILGDWADTGFFIGADGTVMAGKMIEKEVDGKKVRTLDQTPGNLRNVNTINKLLVGKIDKYKYEEKVDSFVDALGKDEVTTLALGTYSRQGIGTTVEDITKREYILPGDKAVLLSFIQSENDKIREIAGTNIQKASILMDSAIVAPNGQPYTLTNDPKEAAKGENFILKEYDPNIRDVVYKISDAQTNAAENFIRANMRVKYDRVIKKEAISQPTDQRRTPSGGGDSGGKKEPQPEISPSYSVLNNISIGGKLNETTKKTEGGIKIQDGSRAFPISNLTLGDSPSEKDQNAQALIVSPGGKIYLQISKPNYTKTGALNEYNLPITTSEPIVSLLDFGVNSTEIGRYARRAGFKDAGALQNYAIQLAGDEFITTPDERRTQTTPSGSSVNLNASKRKGKK
jgi:hypothetical protein